MQYKVRKTQNSVHYNFQLIAFIFVLQLIFRTKKFKIVSELRMNLTRIYFDKY